MSKYAKSYFENPYLEEEQGEKKYRADVIMDEARQKWRTGSWRARPNAFELDTAQLTSEPDGSPGKKPDRPSPSRFGLDIHKDLTGDTISRKALEKLDYSSSYRPRGELDEQISGRRSTLQRYDILAGELEAPPEDISFVSDAVARREREKEHGELHTGRLRRDTRRLESSVDERRSEIMRMLPVEEDDSKEIVAEAAKRKHREDAEKGRKFRKAERKSRYAEQRGDAAAEEYEGLVTVSRLERLPEQAGMSESSIELPEFTTEARYWSQINQDNPTWSQVAAHSVYNVPSDEDSPEMDTRFVRPDDGEDRSEYGFTAVRARVRSEEAGEFKNEYIREANIDPERVKSIMNHHYRGRWIPPEFFADNRLVEDYFNALSSGRTNGDDFIKWAYKKKAAEKQRQEMAEQARRQYMRALRTPHTGRRRSPFMEAQPGRAPRSGNGGQYEEARQRGYRQGVELSGSQAAGPQPGRMPYSAVPQTAQSGQYRGMYPELFAGTNPQPQMYYQQTAQHPPQGYAPQWQPYPPQGQHRAAAQRQAQPGNRPQHKGKTKAPGGR